jgi:hypothetical protein
MKRVIQLEELAMFLLSIYLFSQLSFAWWWFPVLILAPDISMISYVCGNKTGATIYNIFHHKALSIALYLFGSYLQNEVLQLGGIILFGHSSMDRMFSYGLKTFQGFKFTHLGEIGK